MIGYLILAVLVAFIAVVAIRTIRFRPKPQPEVTKEEIAFDRDAAVDSLAQLVRCKTVSYNDHSLEDEGEFQKLISLLPTLYPNVFGTCTFQQLPDRALLLRWPGKQEGDPAVMMAHYDVVPVSEEKWDKPPFAGVIEDGILWGRGTLDTKVTFNGVLSAANYLIGQGFQPEKDIYFAFSGGEEINGQGAPNIVAYFTEHGIHPAIVVDEGGAVVENVFPGVKQPCGLIGIAEKGMLNAQYRLRRRPRFRTQAPYPGGRSGGGLQAGGGSSLQGPHRRPCCPDVRHAGTVFNAIVPGDFRQHVVLRLDH